MFNLSKYDIYFLKYSFYGAISAVIDLLIFLLLVQIYPNDYLIVNLCSYIVSSVLNHFFLINFVFNYKYARKLKTVVIFNNIINILGLFLTQAILYILIDVINFYQNFSKIIAMSLVFILGFLIRKIILFKKYSIDLK